MLAPLSSRAMTTITIHCNKHVARSTLRTVESQRARNTNDRRPVRLGERRAFTWNHNYRCSLWLASEKAYEADLQKLLWGRPTSRFGEHLHNCVVCRERFFRVSSTRFQVTELFRPCSLKSVVMTEQTPSQAGIGPDRSES